jgi:hypothetical protein
MVGRRKPADLHHGRQARVLQMRDYSKIAITRHKWENWDCCPEHLRIDLNHKVARSQEYSEMRYSANEIGALYKLNQLEAKFASRLHHGKNINQRTEESLHAAMINYLALIPKGSLTLRQHALEYKHSPAYLHKLVKKYGIEPVAVMGEIVYYDTQVLEHFYKKGL